MGNATITLDEHALMRSVVLRVKDVPLFYLPAFYYPMEKDDRSTGFLLPTYGASNLRGSSLSNAFFWAISRSQDATFFHDWTSKFGQGFGSEYRYVKSLGSRGTAKFFMTNTPATFGDEGAAATSASRSYDVAGDVNQALPRNFRLIGRVNYFTDIATQQLYQDAYQSDQRQRRDITANVSGSLARMRITAGGELHEYFYDRVDSENGVVSASRQRNGRMPTVNLSMPDRAIGSSRVYLGGSAQASYLLDQQNLNDPLTKQNLFRFDGGPSIRAPLSTLSFLSATADASWRITHWSKSYVVTNLDDPTEDRLQVPIGLTRQLFEVEASMTGPVLARIFPARGLKHVIEPRFSIGRTSSFADSDPRRRDRQRRSAGGWNDHGELRPDQSPARSRRAGRARPAWAGARGPVCRDYAVLLLGAAGLHLRPRLLEQPGCDGVQFFASEYSRVCPRERRARPATSGWTSTRSTARFGPRAAPSECTGRRPKSARSGRGALSFPVWPVSRPAGIFSVAAPPYVPGTITWAVRTGSPST